MKKAIKDWKYDAMADQQDWVVADKVRTTTIML
jgi:hypothetical protein